MQVAGPIEGVRLRSVQEVAEVALDGTRQSRTEQRKDRDVAITDPGVPLDPATPPTSRPPVSEPIQSMADIGRRTVRARVAVDGTRWCRCCDTTTAPGRKSAYCPEHLRERNPFLKRLRRQEAREAATAASEVEPTVPEGMVLVPIEALRLIASRAAQMSVNVARASEHYHALRERDGRDPVWLDNLMWSAKHLDAAITSGLLNGDVLPPHRVPTRLPARAGRSTPQPGRAVGRRPS